MVRFRAFLVNDLRNALLSNIEDNRCSTRRMCAPKPPYAKNASMMGLLFRIVRTTAAFWQRTLGPSFTVERASRGWLRAKDASLSSALRRPPVGVKLEAPDHGMRTPTPRRGDRTSFGFPSPGFSLKFIAALSVALISSGCPHYSTGLPPSLRLPPLKQDVPASGVFHSVTLNETLSAISKAYGVDLQVLAEVNNLRPPYVIRAESKIFIPGASETRKVESSPAMIDEKPKVQDFSGVLAWPVDGKIISEFGVRGGTQHNGISIQAAEGTPVRAAAGGRVGHVGALPGYGNVVLMEHANRMVTVYAHLKDMKVAAGDTLDRGRVIGTVGMSGRAETPNLHFEVRSKSEPRNPLFFLERKPDSNESD